VIRRIPFLPFKEDRPAVTRRKDRKYGIPPFAMDELVGDAF
jgi:hypothetical protein